MGVDMTKRFTTGLALLGWLFAGTAAFAQDAAPADTAAASPQKPAESDKDAVKVTVRGHKKSLKAADRDVYDVSQDPTTKTGTIADTLRKIPGVFVDSAGNVTLRGKPVTILVDGHPSLMLAGNNQAMALKAMPSSFISAVEVITSPGAQYGSDGGAVINLITNHGMPMGVMANASVQTGSTGNSANGFASYHMGRLTAQFMVNGNQDHLPQTSAATMETLDPAGRPVQTTQTHGTARNDNRAVMLSGQIEYELTHDDILSAKVQAMDNRFHGRDMSSSESLGLATNIYDTTTATQGAGKTHSLEIGWVHFGALPDEKLSITATAGRQANGFTTQTVDSYSVSSLPANRGDRTSRNQTSSGNDNAVLSVDYVRPIGDDQLQSGFQIIQDRNLSADASVFPDALTAPAGVDLLTNSRFYYRQTLSAAYVTFQREFGDRWTVLGGLRAETLDLDTNFITLGTTGHLVYTRLNPSLFATYVFSSRAKLQLIYTHRLQRPQPRQLNPYVVLETPQSVTAGNPHLKPQDTDTFEARYTYAKESTSLMLRGFHSRDTRLITTSSLVIPDPQNAGNQVVETMSRNFGFRSDTGVEANYSHPFWKKLYVFMDVTGTLTRLRNPDVPGIQSGANLSGTLSLNYPLTTATGLSFTANRMGRQLTGQGYWNAGTFTNLGLYHSLTPTLSVNLSVNDPFRTSKSRFVIETNSFHNTSSSRGPGPTFMISLSRSFSRFAK